MHDDFFCIRQTLAGETRYFGHLVDRHKDLAFAMAYRITWNTEDAEEIVQDGFVKAYRHLGQFKGDSKFSTWLCQIVYRTAISRNRKKQPVFQEIPAGLHHSETPDMQLERQEQHRLLHKTLCELTEDERALITLYYMDDMPVREMAAVLGISEANAKVKLHRCRQKMQGIIEKTQSL